MVLDGLPRKPLETTEGHSSQLNNIVKALEAMHSKSPEMKHPNVD